MSEPCRATVRARAWTTATVATRAMNDPSGANRAAEPNIAAGYLTTTVPRIPAFA